MFGAASNFESRFGKRQLMRLVEVLNNLSTYPDLQDRADAFGTSKVNMCRYKQTMFTIVMVPNKETVEWFESEKKNLKGDIEEIDEVLTDIEKRVEPLRLI